MLRRPLTDRDFSSSTWQTHSSTNLDIDGLPGSLKLNILGSNPYDLTSAALPPLSTNNALSATDTFRSRPYPPFNPFSTPMAQDPFQQKSLHDDTTMSQDDLDQDDIWITAATISKPDWNKLASWDDDNSDEEDDLQRNPERQVSASPFLTESSDCIEALYQFQFPDTVVVDQERITKDVLYLLTGIPSLCFEWKQCTDSGTKGTFQLRTTRIRLVDVNADALQHLLEPMMLFGTRMKHLDHFIHHVQGNPSVFGLIATSFACCLGELVSYLQYSIYSLFSSTTMGDQPLLAIHHRMEGFFLLMHHLTDLCSLESTKNERYTIPRGSDLMSLIYNKALHMDDLQAGYLGFLRAIYMTLLINTTAPWLDMITQWLNEGSFYDTYKEFFITKKGTSLNPSALPCFLSLQTSKMILRAGMSIQQRQLDATKPLHPFDLSWLDPSRFPHDTSDKSSYPKITRLDHPPTLSALPHPGTHLQQNRPSVITLERWISYQENNYVPPLTVFLQQQIIDPIQHRCHSINHPPSPTRETSRGRRDLMFTYWTGHVDEHPTTFYIDLVSPPFTLATFLKEQRQKQTSRQ